ncbi:restriction endonuclease subunit S [Segatella copri]|uniref:Type I restriction modification DNA specificity domain protein n=1 Tax=Segatella copri DSM 18205 TaxID=537011 RepID=D1PEN6_9BACT|nr:restriction endonuclease subunit S [Segatella copri]EFB34828.1 type I restriction modification DNA specificity domain protein [Segatella copri DSM 18205]MQP19937.1 restriction endonuclease subunit S [Segatella copri DSM 18205]UEA43914.1 restriction endonuclease subunit S [Segatella copri DSM 18205]UWP51473.1 restriction endonuclease subunit S [Segatella copri DSM 18205]
MDTKALRQKILDLAIHGKLVPQDPNDEPASVLLERIRAEKERLIKEGKIKKGKKSAKTSDKPHYPFELPKGWVWTTVGEITNYGDSVNVQVEDIDNSDWVLELEDIEKDTAKIIQHLNKNERKINGTRHKFQKGQILYSKLRTYLNKVLVAPNDGFCTTEIMAFGSYGILSNNYICYVLRSLYFLDYTLQCGYGVKMPRLSTTDACNGLIPLPPLAEQERIVNEIQRLFSIIDIVENGKDGLQTAIQQAKNKILDHAIHGKLVPQDPNDEPASELLKRINPKAEITCDNPQYGKLPKGWCETTLGNTIVIKSGDAIKVRDNRIGKYPIYGGNGITGYNESYNVDGINIIIGRVGFYCGSVHYVNNKIWVTDNAFVTKIMGNVYTPKFLYYLLQQYDLQQYSNSTAQPVISGKTVYPINVMLPPLSEQYRIVAKIEELFSQLDKIESSLQA